MSVQKKKKHKLPAATAWPDEQVTDEEFAQWAETHSLEKLLGTDESVPIKRPAQSPTGVANHKQLKRLCITLRITSEELETARRIARTKAIPYTTLLRSWICEGLKREQRRATG
jgi:predicted DNA binding CopG/RHH family protein